MKNEIQKLVDAVDAQGGLPDELEGAINDLLDTLESRPSWWKAPFFKDGKFSKTATFSTLASVVTLFWYGMSIFATGEPWDLGPVTLPAIQKLDPALALAVLGLANGTYIGNNIVKKNTSS